MPCAGLIESPPESKVIPLPHQRHRRGGPGRRVAHPDQAGRTDRPRTHRQNSAVPALGQRLFVENLDRQTGRLGRGRHPGGKGLRVQVVGCGVDQVPRQEHAFGGRRGGAQRAGGAGVILLHRQRDRADGCEAGRLVAVEDIRAQQMSLRGGGQVEQRQSGDHGSAAGQRPGRGARAPPEDFGGEVLPAQADHRDQRCGHHVARRHQGHLAGFAGGTGERGGRDDVGEVRMDGDRGARAGVGGDHQRIGGRCGGVVSGQRKRGGHGDRSFVSGVAVRWSLVWSAR